MYHFDITPMHIQNRGIIVAGRMKTTPSTLIKQDSLIEQSVYPKYTQSVYPKYLSAEVTLADEDKLFRKVEKPIAQHAPLNQTFPSD